MKKEAAITQNWETKSCQTHCNSDALESFWQRMETLWPQCFTEWKSRGLSLYILTASKVSKSLRLRPFQASVMSNVLYGCESWKMTENEKRKLSWTASKMLATITGRSIQEEARNPTINVVMTSRDRNRSWLGHTSYECHSTVWYAKSC